MKKIGIILAFLATGIFSLVSAQDNQRKMDRTGLSESMNENPVISKIEAVNTFKLPLTVQVLSGSERDESKRVIVRGWNIKGKVVSSAVSSVGNLGGGAGGGAAAASYAATGRIIFVSDDGKQTSGTIDQNGNFSAMVQHDGVYTIFLNSAEYGQVIVKTKHDTAKNSIGNIR